jgi:hypothetical protein
MSGLLSSFENAVDMEMPRPGSDEITKELLSKYNKRLRERGEEEEVTSRTQAFRQ